MVRNFSLRSRHWLAAVALTAFTILPASAGQTPDPTASPIVDTTPAADTTSTADNTSNQTEPPRYGITTALVSIRMRSAGDLPVKGSTKDRIELEMQHKEKFEGWVNLDPAGIFSLHTSISSGYYFTRSYAETGWGSPWYQERGANLFMRQLYMQVEAVKGLQVQYGSLGIEHGTISENISYDEDGYIAGERIMLKRPKDFYFDEVAITYAYIGDYTKPNMFSRLDRFAQSNYHQFLVAKTVAHRVKTSLDLTHHGWSETVRLGAIADIHEIKALDSIRFGYYDRYHSNHGTGFEISAERHILKNLKVSGGYVDIDLNYKALETPYDKLVFRTASATLGPAPGGPVMADRFGLGHQPWGMVAYKINPVMSVSFFARGLIFNDSKLVNTYRSDILALDFNLLPLTHRMGIH